MTVRQLLLALRDAKPEAEVRVAYNTEFSYDDAKSVEFTNERGQPIVYISTQEEEQT